MGEIEYFKESVYLDSDNQEVIEYINEMKHYYELAACQDQVTYNSSIDAYHKFVKFVAYLIKSLNLENNAITASIIIDILIKQGTFSVNGKYSKLKYMKQNLMGCFGIDLIIGAGVCRNTTSFHADVLEAMNMMSYPFYCYGTRESLEDGNDYHANHVVNLIEYDGALYGYDAFNSMLFNFVSKYEMVEFFSVNPFRLYYKPYVDMIVDGLSLNNVDSLLTLFDMVKHNKLITLSEYKDMWEYAKRVTSENDYLFDLFKESAKKYIREITKGLN